ncbi:hypothetical protein [Helicobacter brantae]|uniref:Periplasmic protein n=1 Tax=Helicobacter brantae TaxID=375927 RepID=A0A3D8J362_9HELI|nr:hypothetical protein [Helicobacter brantae]RDU71201.1 hypothetical protein CQA58_03555 [Helicobacter brantae]
MKALFIILLTLISLSANPLNLQDPRLSKPQEEIIAQFGNIPTKSSSLKIALMMPKKIIGRYSVATIDTILAYLSARGGDFELEVFDCGDEEESSIKSFYQQIYSQDFHFIIAIFTTKGAYESTKLSLKIPLYIPTVNKTQIDFDPSLSPLLFFGGISYEDQINELLKFQSGTHTIAYNDDSPVGERLSLLLQEKIPQIQEQTITNEIAATFSKSRKTQEELIYQADVFLNTPVVKTGLLLSQIGYFKKKASSFLSTQINYNPSLGILTQQRDRENLYIANSIGEADQKLIEYASLLNSDLKYDWVNYSTALGMEIFYRLVHPESLAYFKENILDNQMQYQVKIYQIDTKGFYEVKPPQREYEELGEEMGLENP